MPEEDSYGNTPSKDQAILVVPASPDQNVVNIKRYCHSELPKLCAKHITSENNDIIKEVIAIIDVTNVQGVPEFGEDLHEVLRNYDVTIHTGVDYHTCPVTCLVLYIIM